MNYSNPRYQNQGIHVLATIFTVENGVFKVLLINRKNEPYKNMWSLVGGAVYCDERVEDALRREVKEKTGIENISFRHFGIYSRPDRAPKFRMLGLGYIAVVDHQEVTFLRETTQTNNAEWFDIKKLPPLAFDHEEIVLGAIAFLKANINDGEILKELFPQYFTLPELHKAYECILDRKLDRRNFRKKLLKDGIIEDTGLMSRTQKVKSSKLYQFAKLSK